MLGHVSIRIPILFLLYFGDISSSFNNDEVGKIDIKMPNVKPLKPDSYFCTATKMPDNDVYIVGYEPHAKMKTAHHMLMFGCDEVNDVGSKGYWVCGEMRGTCTGRVNKIMYAWAMDAPSLELPKDVGFHIGGSSRVKYVVLQVHYNNVDTFVKHHDKTDHSGVTLHLQSQKPKYFAGIYLVAAGGPPIPPKQDVFDMNMACEYSVGPEMHPFAFRVHTHKLGYVVTGYRVRNGKWHLIGKGDPRRPQAFYKVNSEESLLPGDKLAARCTYNSMKRDSTTYIGATGADEMCNFYLMYWYDPAEGRSTDACKYVSVHSSEYPADTDIPLPADKKMEMKREMSEDDNVVKSGILLEQREGFGKKLEYGALTAGQVSGVAVDGSGNVIIFHRGNRIWDARTFDINNFLNRELRREAIRSDPVWFLHKDTSKVFNTWGKDWFYFPHGITIDKEDNMWFTDVGLHQVLKFSKNGTKELVLGVKFVPGSDREHFCKPTDVAVASDGTFFVSDGYCNRRIIKFSTSGKIVLIIEDHLLSSTPGFPKPANFAIPHSIVLDKKEEVLYVADRENGRVLTFHVTSGQYEHYYTGFGDRVFAIVYSPLQGGLLHVVNGQSYRQPFIFGSTLHLKTKQIIERWQPTTRFSYPHDVTCDHSGKSVYVSEITSPGKLWKFHE